MKKSILGYGYGLALAIAIALICQWPGRFFPVVGGAVFALVFGMLLQPYVKNYSILDAGLTFTSKKVLQYAVILLGFGLDLSVVMDTGKQSLPIILSTISISLVVAYLGFKIFNIPADMATLVGVGSSICGGSAIAATAPVIEAKDEDVAQAISVIFFFNLLAAILFPSLGQVIGFSQESGSAFGLFAGTAINDTSSVTAAATTWDNLFHLGSQTLDTAVTVKLTRTLAIIPITTILAYLRSKHNAQKVKEFSIKKVFPTFILFFILAVIITTLCHNIGLSKEIFMPAKWLSKFFITMAMAAIGLRSQISTLIKSGKRALLLGLACWLSITIISIIMQKFFGIG